MSEPVSIDELFDALKRTAQVFSMTGDRYVQYSKDGTYIEYAWEDPHEGGDIVDVTHEYPSNLELKN